MPSAPLADLTTMRVGGPARELVTALTRDELIETALDVWRRGEDWLVLGGGSNVVIADAGFDGMVIRVGTSGIDRATDGMPRLRVQAGESWDGLVEYAVSHGLAGIEALSGIPGSAGAAPIQNIGAYGQELADRLVGVDFLDYETGEVVWLAAAELGFGYRTSALKRGRAGIVLAIELELANSAEGVIAYPQLATALGVELGSTAPLAEIRAGVLALRRAKGMVLDPTDSDSVSCGSFFTNPIVSENFARGLPRAAPRWPVEPAAPDLVVALGESPARPPYEGTDVKLSAAWLIESAGVVKGFSLPGSGAAVSSKHTLAITNRGGATAEQVAELARFIQAVVVAQFGVLLQPEPVLVGLEL